MSVCLSVFVFQAALTNSFGYISIAINKLNTTFTYFTIQLHVGYVVT